MIDYLGLKSEIKMRYTAITKNHKDKTVSKLVII